MKVFLSWRVLFGLSLLLTVIFFTVIIFSARNDRQGFQIVIAGLIAAVDKAQKNNQKLITRVDSMNRQVSVMASTITKLQAQKDSLTSRNRSVTVKVERVTNPKPSKPTALRRPVFNVVDKTGKIVGTDGVAPDSLRNIRVTAGTGYSIRSMDVMQGRGTASVTRIKGVQGNWDWGSLNITSAPGDRIVVDIQRVTRDDTGENVSVGTVLLTIPIRPTKQPYYSVREVSTGEVITSNGFDHRNFQGIMVMAGQGYTVDEMDISIMRGNSSIFTKKIKSYKVDIRNFNIVLQQGDKVIVDIKTVSVAGPLGSARNLKGEVITVPLL